MPGVGDKYGCSGVLAAGRVEEEADGCRLRESTGGGQQPASVDGRGSPAAMVDEWNCLLSHRGVCVQMDGFHPNQSYLGLNCDGLASSYNQILWNWDKITRLNSKASKQPLNQSQFQFLDSRSNLDIQTGCFFFYGKLHGRPLNI